MSAFISQAGRVHISYQSNCTVYRNFPKFSNCCISFTTCAMMPIFINKKILLHTHTSLHQPNYKMFRTTMISSHVEMIVLLFDNYNARRRRNCIAIIICFLLSLESTEPVTTIYGGLERHIKFGSQINLTCQIKFYPEALKYVIWYRNDEVSRVFNIRKSVLVFHLCVSRYI